MPKCFIDGVEQPILKSITVAGQMMGVALCDNCLKLTPEEQAKKVTERMAQKGGL